MKCGGYGRQKIHKGATKIIIKLSNRNSNQGFISNILNVRQACIRKFLKWWKCWPSVEKWLQTGRPPNLIEGVIAIW